MLLIFTFFFLAGNAFAEDVIEWGSVDPCTFTSEYETVDWRSEPEQAMSIEIGDCVFIVEYYLPTSMPTGRHAFNIVGIYQIPIGDYNNCAEIDKSELYGLVTAKMIEANVLEFSPDPNMGYIYNFYAGSCLRSHYRHDYPYDPINDPQEFTHLSFSKPMIEILPPEGGSGYEIDLSEFESVAIGDVTGFDWSVPIIGGYSSCYGSSVCCRATFYVTLDNDGNVSLIERVGDVVHNEYYECPNPIEYVCVPSCDEMFDKYEKKDEYYELFIFPSPATTHIYLAIPDLPADIYEVHIINQNGVVVKMFYLTMTELTHLDLTQLSLDPGGYWVRIVKGGAEVATSNFIQN